MVHKNKYVNSSKISEVKFREIISYFVADLSATQISILSGISRNLINKYLMAVRQRIYDYCLIDSPFGVSGDIKLDESYFGAKVVRGKRGGKVYTEIVLDCKSKTL